MNHRTLWKLVALSLSLSAPAALADWRSAGNIRGNQARSSEEAERARQNRGLALGLRAGYGLPFGEAGAVDSPTGGNLSDAVSGVIPLQLDAGYFFNSNVYLGASFQYGMGLFSEGCSGGVECSASQLRVGANLIYHIQAAEKLEPWLGLGLGYESLDMSVSMGSDGASAAFGTSIRGFELTFLGGLDYRVTRMFSVGPFATFTAGQYLTVASSIELEGDNPLFENVETSEPIEEKAFHSWLYGGVRMQIRF